MLRLEAVRDGEDELLVSSDGGRVTTLSNAAVGVSAVVGVNDAHLAVTSAVCGKCV